MWETWVWSLGWENLLEKGMATHSYILAWRIPWTEEPDGPQSMGSQRVGYDWVTWHACIENTPVILNTKISSTWLNLITVYMKAYIILLLLGRRAENKIARFSFFFSSGKCPNGRSYSHRNCPVVHERCWGSLYLPFLIWIKELSF